MYIKENTVVSTCGVLVDLRHTGFNLSLGNSYGDTH
jgi:hypothetical protein